MRPALVPLVLAALLASVGAASAALPAGNIVQNGDAEAGPAATNQTDAPAPVGWQQSPNFTTVAYGSSGFPSLAVSSQIGGGRNFFAGGPDNGFGGSSAAVQQIDLSASAADLDASNVVARLSADLGGAGSQGDSATVVVAFVDASGNSATGGLALAAVGPQDRGNATGFVHRTACAQLNPGTRSANVEILASRTDPPYDDAYADNVSLTLSTTPCSAGTTQPLPPPAQPQPGLSGNAKPTSGHVFVKVPGSSRFQALEDARSIPIGSELNTEKGAVQLQTAADFAGKLQQGTFSGAKFVVRQKPARRPFTDLLLSGSRLNKCARAGRRVSTAAKRRSRRLFGRGRGRFRTRGRFASATVRGTSWVTKDTCTSTTVTARSGTVIVRDFAKRKTIRLRAPRSYTARAKKKR